MIDIHNSTDNPTLPLVIVNPRSASGATEKRWAATASELRTHFGAFRVAFTGGPGDAITIAETSAASGTRFIIACGGDGTINEVANGILRSGADAELGILPSGTGGDLRRTLGIPGTTRAAAIALRDGVTKTMDAGRVTFQSFEGAEAERYFLNVSSIGLAAHVIKRVKANNQMKWLPIERIRGRANFGISALQEVLDHDAVGISVRIDGGIEKTIHTLAFCVANARYFGGGMMIAPDAQINDGLLDVINIGDISTAKILLNAHLLYRGTHQSLDEVSFTTAKTIDVASVDPLIDILIETDGELPGKLPAKYEIVHDALKIRVPSTN